MRHHLRRTTLSIALSFLCAPAAFAATVDPTLGAWRDYALRGVTPDFSWSDREDATSTLPTVFDASERARDAATPRFDVFAMDRQGALSLAVSQTFNGDLPAIGGDASSFATQRVVGAGLGLERTMIAPSLSRPVGNAIITGSVVLAYQQFASWGLGTTMPQENTIIAAPYTESSFGSGVRIGYEQPLGERLSFTAAYQSRLNMDAFQSYRGVYSDPGDFDLPSIASAGIGFRTSDRSALGLGVSRVGYSEINAFTSSALPTRFLSLLGDGFSPEFAWRDLTVYSLDWQWRPAPRDTIALRYTTQQQPEPTSRLLYSALRDTFTDDNYAIDYTHRFQRFGSLRLAASYAPVQYFLGNVSYAARDAKGDQVELQAAWTVEF